MEEEEEEVTQENASVQQQSSSSSFVSRQTHSTVTTRYGLSASSFSSRFLENAKLLQEQQQEEAEQQQQQRCGSSEEQSTTKRPKTGDTLAVSPGRSPDAASSRVSSSSSAETGRQQWLTASTAGGYRENAKSMESLRPQSHHQHQHQHQHHHHRQSFITSSERDMRRVVATSVEARSLESLEREIRLMGKRRAVSGEDLGGGGGGGDDPGAAASAAERRRGLYAAGDRKMAAPQHLSLPPPCGDRRLTILSPHSPGEALLFASSFATLRTRRKKAIVLPKLILPRSESDVFLE